MTDEQKAQLKEQAKVEDVTPSYRHVDPVERAASPRSEGAQSRGPSRSNPLFLGRIAIAANRTNAFPRFGGCTKYYPSMRRKGSSGSLLESTVDTQSYIVYHS